MEEKELINEEETTMVEQPQAIEPEEEKFAEGRAKAKWYALHTFTGYETMVEENLRTVVEKNREKLESRIFDIIIPMEDVIEEKRGKRKIVSRKLMPGYVLCKMIYGDDIWHDVTRTRGITGFVGPKGRPLPLTDEEVQKMRLEKVKIDINIKVGDKVEIVDGPLISQIGEITAVDMATGKVKANVNMFGRVMAVDLELSQIRRI